jgi:hypothetical protein
MQLTKIEVDALITLEERGPRLLFGTPSRDLQELADAGHIQASAPVTAEMCYEITEAGRKTLQAIEGEPMARAVK